MYLLTLVYFLVVFGLAIACGCFAFKQPVSAEVDKGQFGLRTVKSKPCSEFNRYFLTSIVFGVNAAASFVILASDNAKIGLLAPTPKQFQAGTIDLGYQSLDNVLKTPFFRKVLWMILFLTSLPIHYLYEISFPFYIGFPSFVYYLAHQLSSSNSIFFMTEPSYKSYEVLASTSFFENHDFNITNLTMTEFQNLPLSIPFNRRPVWPQDYSGVLQLENSLQSIQNGTSKWTNMSRSDCTKTFNQASNPNYLTLVVVTNYTTPTFNNSALALSVLPGFRSISVGSSLLALCPDAYLATYKGVSKPLDAVYISDAPYGNADSVAYVDPAVAEENGLNGTSLIHETSRLGIRQGGPVTPVYYNPLSETELCYFYWPNNTGVYTPGGSTTVDTYVKPRVPFLYCLAEPVSEPSICRLVYSPMLLFVMAIVLVIKAAVIFIALCLRVSRIAFYRWLDVKEYYHGGGESQYKLASTIASNRKSFRFRYLAVQAFLYLILFIWLWILWGASNGSVVKLPFQPRSLRWVHFFISSIFSYQ